MTEEFYIGQIFYGTYPESVAEWCNNQDSPYITIKEIEPQDGERVFKIVDITPTAEEQAQKERERLNLLSMTRSDFFDGMIMAFGLDSKELRVIVENVLGSINITPVQIRVALNNYDNALNFYRKHTLFTLLNGVEIPINEDITLVFTSDIWDKFFDTKDYKELQKAIQVELEPKSNSSVSLDEGTNVEN